jgi:riboflavin synthase
MCVPSAGIGASSRVSRDDDFELRIPHFELNWSEPTIRNSEFEIRNRVMFTGIVQAVGRIAALERRARGVRLRIECDGLDLSAARVGDSIAVNGVCLTAIEVGPDFFAADISVETLARTTFADVAAGSRVNLEKALALGEPLGGHLVSGHVDGIGSVLQCAEADGSVRLRVHAPPPLARYIAEKGSICVDGVSLTVNAVAGAEFDLMLVPHTRATTTLGDCRPGRQVNLEVDLIARYLERLLNQRDAE